MVPEGFCDGRHIHTGSDVRRCCPVYRYDKRLRCRVIHKDAWDSEKYPTCAAPSPLTTRALSHPCEARDTVRSSGWFKCTTVLRWIETRSGPPRMKMPPPRPVALP